VVPNLEVYMLRNKTPLALLVLVLMVATVYLMGCGDFDSPLTNGSSSNNITFTEMPPLDGVTIISRAEHGGGYDLLGDPIWDSVILGTSGGKLELEDIMVYVPEKAVSSNFELSIYIPEPSLYVFELGPDGYNFSRDVTITVSLEEADLKMINPQDLVIVTYDEKKGEWNSEGGTYDARNNTISVQARHFSYWALAGD
jgi:hypothetical protein